MNPTQQTIGRIVEIITKNNSCAIVLPQNPLTDTIASATALYLALVKIQKSVSLTCISSIQSDLVASDKIQKSLAVGGDNLVCSFPYTDGSIDKIDYAIKGDVFNLIVTPRPGFPKLDPKNVTYSYTGGTIDFIIVIDAPNLNSLGSVYSDNPTQFQGRNIINIDRHLTNGYYGSINYVDKSSASMSELIYKVIKALQIEVDKDIATNLYAGITTATNGFTSYSVNADTFETIAQLLKAGALKKIIRQPSQSYQAPPRPMSPPLTPTIPSQPPVVNTIAPTFQKSQPFEKQTPGAIRSVEQEARPKEGATDQDWLKPQIENDGIL